MQGFFYLSNVLCLHNLKFMNEMRSNRPKKNQLPVYPNLQAIVEKLANSENPTAPI